ncbi:hypothetical protein DFH28DRAFT_932543 [Melampsora americana]|nr:hypothetical protein DFH28DRAFT_932543 [Melampsora americana]
MSLTLLILFFAMWLIMYSYNSSVDINIADMPHDMPQVVRPDGADVAENDLKQQHNDQTLKLDDQLKKILTQLKSRAQWCLTKKRLQIYSLSTTSGTTCCKEA